MRQQAYPSGAVHIGGYKTARRFEVRQQWSALADFLEIVNVQWNTGLASDSEQVKNRVGRAPARSHPCNRILERRPRQTVSGFDASVQQVHHHGSAVISDLVFLGVHGGNAVEAHGRKS